MALDAGLVGRRYPPGPLYEVGREKIREFAEAIGDPNPIYTDPQAARAAGHPDVIAPPTFPVVFTFPAGLAVLDDPDIDIDYSRVVHGGQEFAHARALRAGDRVRTSVEITGARTMAGSDILTLAAGVDAEDGEHVTTAVFMMVARAEGEE